MKAYKQIEELLGRFFEGRTSNEEERILYDFFAQGDVPAHLRSYKGVFGYFEKGIAGEFRETPELKLPVSKPFRGKHALRLGVALLAAASLALLLVHVIPVSVGDESAFNPYEESYIVRNGKRITDWNEIREEIESTRLAAAEKQRQADCLLRKAEEMEFLSKTKDRLLADRYHRLLQGIPGGVPRQVASKILKERE